jgi:hypothetical protein
VPSLNRGQPIAREFNLTFRDQARDVTPSANANWYSVAELRVDTSRSLSAVSGPPLSEHRFD